MPTWSPDGEKVLFTSYPQDSGDLADFAVYVLNAADGTELTDLTPTGKIDVASGVSCRSQPYETLAVTKVVPADTSKGVERTANVRSYFSEAMNTATINETTLKLYRRCAGAGSYIFLPPPR